MVKGSTRKLLSKADEIAERISKCPSKSNQFHWLQPRGTRNEEAGSLAEALIMLILNTTALVNDKPPYKNVYVGDLSNMATDNPSSPTRREDALITTAIWFTTTRYALK
jgi:hypothetical protein